jgi:hypothetical protein
MPEAVPAQKTGPGWTTDPYADEGGECDDLISKITAKFTGKGGTWSTWRERHISIEGICDGLRAGTLSDVPKCPPLWYDEAQYYDGCAMIANVVKCQWPGILTTLAGVIAAAKIAGII